MLIHRTMADPAFVDLSIEPDDRVLSAYNNDPRPDLVNWGTGVAAVITPEAWLSTWSGISSHARTELCLSAVTTPLLVVHYVGDVITRLSEVERFFAAAASQDKQLVKVRHADHYGFTIKPDGTRGDRSQEGTDAVVSWMRGRFLVDKASSSGVAEVAAS
jgi:pimeloyl-ACP methyl ester carboxylesterase